MNNSLLPINGTEYEKSVESSSARAFDLPVDVDTLWNPETCPEYLLPWLAWALSVDTWDSAWPVDIKRDFIANSFSVHQKKGTLSAIRSVLDNLGISIDIVEWFDSGTEPHTFTLTASANANLTTDDDPVLGPSLYKNLVNVVNNVKPVRSHYDFRVGVSFESSLGMTSSAFSLAIRWAAAVPKIEPQITAPLALVTVARPTVIVRKTFQTIS